MPVQEIDLGKVVGPPGPAGADGTPGERGPGSSPNLLDNWYFVDPINQRGKTQYTETGFTIDRWFTSYFSSVTLTEAGIVLKQAISNFNFYQTMPDARDLAGKTITFSMLASGNVGVVLSVNGGYPASAYYNSPNVGVLQLTYTMPEVVTTDTLVFFIQPQDSNPVTAIAAKLELGDTQTLARQDANGNWVLNDPPPNKALELAKCQRYYQCYDKNGYCGVGIFSNNRANLFIQTPVTMRTNPAVSISGQFDIRTAGESQESDMTYSGSGMLSDNGISVQNVVVNESFQSALGLFAPLEGFDGLIELSADL